MKLLAISCLALLAGCQTVPLEERARGVSHADLCAAVFYAPPHVSQVARNEAANRGLDCNNFRQEAAIAWSNYQAAERAKTEAMSNMSRQLLQPAPMPQMRHCNSYRVGNSIATDCF